MTIVGDKNRLALESSILRARRDWGHLALGCFVIHIEGQRYGILEPDATMLGCSYQEVKRRLDNRGSHCPFFSVWPNAGEVADAYSQAIYGDIGPEDLQLEKSPEQFREIVYANRVTWAPDGDEAFDDSSYVLQFDVGERVRVIGFWKRANQSHIQGTLRDLWLPADEFYGLLERWLREFELEREAVLQSIES
jgi:hypothetical protein